MIESWVDAKYKFDGLVHFAVWIVKRQLKKKKIKTIIEHKKRG